MPKEQRKLKQCQNQAWIVTWSLSVACTVMTCTPTGFIMFMEVEYEFWANTGALSFTSITRTVTLVVA